MKFAILFHDADFDGIFSKLVCQHWLKRLNRTAVVHAYGWDHGRPLPEPTLLGQLDGNPNEPVKGDWALYDRIFVVDIAPENLLSQERLRSRIVWIDHHKTSIEKWDHIGDTTRMVGYRIDGVAACRLCWQYFESQASGLMPPETVNPYFNRTVSEPELLRLVGEHDIWDHRDPRTKPLQYGLRAITPEDFIDLVNEQFDGGDYAEDHLADALQAGYQVQRYADQMNADYAAKFSGDVLWHGLLFLAVNSSQRNSDAFKDAIRPRHEALLLWRYDHQSHRCIVSLYHAPGKEHIDLSVIAREMGGGGHKGACGFQVPLSFLLCHIINAN